MQLNLRTLVYTIGVAGLVYILGPSVNLNLYLLNPFNLLQPNPHTDEMLMLRRKKKVGRYAVGLANRANDCFANSNIQALASLKGFYIYLFDFNLLSSATSTPSGVDSTDYLLSRALAEMIQELNEPILTPKTLSPWPLLAVLEKIYKSRISRSQHDAHELLHLVLETLQTENDRLRRVSQKLENDDSSTTNDQTNSSTQVPDFPFNGATVDRITCAKCGYTPPANPTNFLVQSLMVPQKRSVQLNDLLSQLSTPEYVKDYGCSRCRLMHVLQDPKSPQELVQQLSPFKNDPAMLPDALDQQLPRSVTSPIAKSTSFHKLPQVLTIHLSRSIYGGYGASRNSCKVSLQEHIELFEVPEGQPATHQQQSGNSMPTPETSKSSSPANTTSNSDDGSASSKTLFDSNGGLLLNSSRRKVKYRLAAMVRHKGTHQTGHYECFRRKHLSFWSSIQDGSIATKSPAAAALALSSAAVGGVNGTRSSSNHTTPPQMDTPTLSSASSVNDQPVANANSNQQQDPPPPAVPPKDATYNRRSQVQSNGTSHSQQNLPYPARSSPSPASLSTSEIVTASSTSTSNGGSRTSTPPVPGGRPDVLPPSSHEWWKISDDKVWECTTRDVLKEEGGAYLLFYEAC